MRIIAVLLLCHAAASGQGGLEGVRSGMLFDPPSASIRIVEGVPGAAHLGRAVEEGVQAAWMSPSGRAVLAKKAGKWAVIQGFGTESAQVAELESEVMAAQWSSSGRFVAVLMEGQAGVWDTEKMDWHLRTVAGGERQAGGIAVDDSGRLWLAWREGDSTRLELWRDGQWQEVGRVRGRGVVACAAGVTALAGEGELAVFRGSEPVWQGETGRQDSPVGLAVFGGEIVAAYAGETPELAWLDMAGWALRRASLETQPERLEPLAGASGLVMRLRARAGEEIWVAVRRGGFWTAFFVPAGE